MNKLCQLQRMGIKLFVCLNYRIRDQLSVVVLREFPKTRSFGQKGS